MGRLLTLTFLAVQFLPVVTVASGKGQTGANTKDAWLGEELPLPLVVHSREDLAFKLAAERQYLIFNLLAAGKVAEERKDMATAATKWETLLGVPRLPEDLAELIRPRAAEARSRAVGSVSEAPKKDARSSLDESKTIESIDSPIALSPVAPLRTSSLTLNGTVQGGGSVASGGTVIWMKRLDGATPPATPGRRKVISMKDKSFAPHILVVTAGTRVDFRNDDPVYHNVFSLSRPNDFDLGLYSAGLFKSRTFSKPGPVNLLCNIHSSMEAFVYVVDTPYYAQAHADGRFMIKGLKPGRYLLEAWNPEASSVFKRPVEVKEGMSEQTIAVNGDRAAPQFVPDKYGKPRQLQLGY